MEDEVPFPGDNKRKVWLEKWEQGATGFHREKVDARLKKHIHKLTGSNSDASVLVTWCGKSLDLPWLCAQGYNSVGVELSEIAVKQLFENDSIPYVTSEEQKFITYTATDRKLKVFVGNFYCLTPEIAGKFDSVWDINALGAAEPKDREAYRSVLISLLKPGGRILLSNYEYNDEGRNKAPYSLSIKQIKYLFGDFFDVQFLENPEEFVDYFKSKFKVDWVKHNVHFLTLK